jgi:hypothetical protein
MCRRRQRALRREAKGANNGLIDTEGEAPASDFRCIARSALGVNDNQRASNAPVAVKGKRLTYRATAGQRRSEERTEPEAPPF